MTVSEFRTKIVKSIQAQMIRDGITCFDYHKMSIQQKMVLAINDSICMINDFEEYVKLQKLCFELDKPSLQFVYGITEFVEKDKNGYLEEIAKRYGIEVEKLKENLKKLFTK